MTLMATSSPAPQASAALSFSNGGLLRDGVPHRILAGSLHYFRVHPDQWADRLARVAAMGLNTVDTYIAWNFHQKRDVAPRFDGWHDVERFIRLAGEAGLDVIVRPGPYVCAEWDNGGLPAWVTGMERMHPRSSDLRFLDAVARWFDQVIPRVAALQAGRGGPVVAVQVENEYGSYGDDHGYLEWVRAALLERGITELLYTADGPTELMLDGGTLPGVLTTATFGSHPTAAKALLRSRRPDEPFICAEFWTGWFDHWGEKHHVRSPASAGATVTEILDAAGSVSIYMAHGGTNFGLWAGANHDGALLQPTATSYDSDAPIAENGALTPKFFELQRILHGFSGATPAPQPIETVPVLTPRTLPVVRGSALLPALDAVAGRVSSPNPLSFEELVQSSGLVLYRAAPILPTGDCEITIRGLRDRAQVFIDGIPAGIIEHDRAGMPLTVTGRGRPVRLEILVENLGRINYGPLLGAGKGILGGVQIDRRLVHGWEMFPVALDDWPPADVSRIASVAPPDGQAGFATVLFEVDQPADTFLALPGFVKGFVWINGFLLGRYWEIGPQVTLYVPAPLLVSGENSIVVLELHRFGPHLELRAEPDLGPTEEFVESF